MATADFQAKRPPIKNDVNARNAKAEAKPYKRKVDQGLFLYVKPTGGEQVLTSVSQTNPGRFNLLLTDFSAPAFRKDSRRTSACSRS